MCLCAQIFDRREGAHHPAAKCNWRTTLKRGIAVASVLINSSNAMAAIHVEPLQSGLVEAALKPLEPDRDGALAMRDRVASSTSSSASTLSPPPEAPPPPVAGAPAGGDSPVDPSVALASAPADPEVAPRGGARPELTGARSRSPLLNACEQNS